MGEEVSGLRTLVLSVAALDLLVDIFLDFTLEDAGPRRLVEAGSFKNVGRIDPVVMAPAHDMFFEVGAKLVLPHWNLRPKE